MCNFGQELVPQQCIVTSLQTHRSSKGTFVLTFPTTHVSILHLTFPFPSPKPIAHQQLNWSRALRRSAPLTRDMHSSIHRFLFPVRPKVSPSICWILFWYFLFFPCSSISVFLHFLCCVYWDLGSLGCECLFIYASFFYFLLKYSFYASLFVFIFWF